jgi:glycosyltransferase involved in cell wall biosynthesis
MKVDLVMWAKNGSETLPQVLKRISDVIPSKNINKRIFVDDHSKDYSVEIAERFGWKVYENREGFISGGVREALKHVTSEFFVSVEQDVILAKDWWNVIPKYMREPNVAVAEGIRIRYPPNKTLDSIEEYTFERFSHRPLHITLDNNIFRTKIIRKIGIPTKYPLSVDLALYERLQRASYKWIIDKNVVSYHLRKGVTHEILHRHKHSVLTKTRRFESTDFMRLLKIFMFSPIRGIDIMIKKRCPTAFFVYPFMRLIILKTFRDRRRYWGKE